MRSCLLMCRAAMVVTALLAARSWAAAPPPRSISDLNKLTQAPTEQQRERLRDFASYWVEQLDSDDPAAVPDARRKLIEQINAPGATLVFMQAYSDALVSQLARVVDDREHPMAAANALQIAALFGTDDALMLMRDHLDADQEDRPAIRLWAARGFQLVAKDGLQRGTITARQIAPALRDLGRAAEKESDWRVLQWQLAAIASTQHPVAEEVLFSSFDATTKRLQTQSEATPLIVALRPALISMRERYFADRSPQEQRRLGQEIAKRLVVVLALARQHADSARSDPEMIRHYEIALQISEQLLQLIDSNLGSAIGPTSLERAYDSGNAEDYDRQLQKIMGAIERPPYR